MHFPDNKIKRGYRQYRTLIKLSLVASTAHLAYGLLGQSAIPPYVQQLGLTAYIGVIYAAFLLTETLFRAPMGTLEDRVGLRPVYILAALLGSSTALAWTLVHSLGYILLIRVFDGVGAASTWTATVVAMQNAVRARQRTTAMGVFTVSYLGGLALGPLLGGYANDTTHSKLTSFYLAALLFLLAGMLAYWLIPSERPARHRAPSRVPPPHFATQIWQAMCTIPGYLLIAFIAFFSIGLLIPIIKLYAMEQLGMSETAYGLLVLPVVLVLAIASFASGTIARFWGKDRSVQVGTAISAIAMFVMPAVHRLWHLGIIATLVGCGFVIGMPAWLALVAEKTSAGVRGSIMGALGTGQGLGIISGALIGPLLYSHLPFHLGAIRLSAHLTPFIASALGLALAFLLSLVFVHDTQEKPCNTYGCDHAPGSQP